MHDTLTSLNRQTYYLDQCATDEARRQWRKAENEYHDLRDHYDEAEERGHGRHYQPPRNLEHEVHSLYARMMALRDAYDEANCTFADDGRWPSR